MTSLRLLPLEGRVLGVLVEKELTTPDAYPLSLNALVNGCNQKSNREPVVNLGEREVEDLILKLRVAGLVEFVRLAGSRVEKYRHKVGTALDLTPAELATLAELLLRDGQQPGELRTRASRMHPLPTQEDLGAALEGLARKGLVVELPRREGERVGRYAQLLAPAEAGGSAPAAPAPRAAPVAATAGAPRTELADPPPPSAAARIAQLEAEVARLRAELAALRPP